jgi:DNA-binding transcriptional LysR family regulator
MTIDLNAWRDFEAVVRAGTITAAARLLGAPKSSVSKRLQDLEAALGVRLIERSTRSLRLTQEGEAFHARVLRVLADADEAIALLRAGTQVPSGHLRLCTPVLLGHAFMGQFAAAFRARNPLTTLEVVLLDRRVDLVEEGFDAAIRVGQLPDSNLIVRPLAEVDHVVVGAPALLGHKPLATPTALAAWPCLAHAVGEATRSRWRLLQGQQQVDVQTQPVIVLSSLPALREAALAGAGLAYLPRFLVAQDLSEARLVQALPGWAGVRVPISVVVPSSRQMPLRVRALIDLLVEEFPRLGLACGA